MKRLWAFILAIAIAVSMTGCGGTTSSEETSQTETEVASSSSEDGEDSNQDDADESMDIVAVLTAEKWCGTDTGDTVLEFYKTGTGRLESSSTKLNFTWNQIEGFDNAIRLEYEYMGANQTADYEVVEIDGIVTLDYVGDGRNYVHLSDYNQTSFGESVSEQNNEANYDAEIRLLTEDIWYFNGGSDTILNGISFTEDAATIAQVYFDGNGKHDSGSNDYTYTIDDNNITVALSDGSDLVIPYVVDGENITLGDHEYFTPSEVDAGLQGYWEVRNGSTEKHILFDNGSVQSEKASEASGGTKGEYYYYGPYTGSYTLNFGGLDTDMRHGNEWFFNIIDGVVTLINYGNVCSPSSGFPGENGYSF